MSRGHVVSVDTAVLIRRDPATVFRYFADLRNEPHWNRGHVRDVRLVSPEPVQRGSLFEGRHPGMGLATWRLVEYESATRLAIEGTVGGAPYRFLALFTPQDSGTRLRGHIEWEPRGAWRLLGPLLPLLLRIQARRSFRNLRTVLESAPDRQ